MSVALAEAAGRYGHVMFPSNLHPPAVQLAQYLLEKGPGRGWAQRVFYSGTVLLLVIHLIIISCMLLYTDCSLLFRILVPSYVSCPPLMDC